MVLFIADIAKDIAGYGNGVVQGLPGCSPLSGGCGKGGGGAPKAATLLEERGTLIAGMARDMLALAVVGCTTQGWIVITLAPLFALGGIFMPALQSLITTQVGEDKQGQLQGVLASLVSLAAVFGHSSSACWILGLVAAGRG